MGKIHKTILVYGRFNVIHPGHLRLLRFARECGTRLVVAVESDRLAGNEAHVPEQLRLEGVASNSYVDEAFITDCSPVEVINQLRPDVVVKGKEHENQYNPEVEVLSEYGGSLLFSSGETIFSSLDLLRREFSEVLGSSIGLPHKFLKRNLISEERLVEICKGFEALRILVIGDLIVDEYITCQPLGMSQEDPTIVVTPLDSQFFIGGASIVAAHAAGLGANVDFISVAGEDKARQFSLKKLREFNVRTHLLSDLTRPTTLKQRYRSKGKTLLRVSHLHQGAIAPEYQKEILKMLKKKINKIDLLIFSDFNYGCLPQDLVNAITSMARANNILLAADSQSSSQIGDISRFMDMDLITPTEHEARIATRNQEDGLVVLAEKLREQAKAKNILLKLGEEGLLIHTWNKINSSVITDQVPALNSLPKDVAGAGDSLLITSAMAIACGANILEAGYLGSMAAAIQVGRVGNTPLRVGELLESLK